MNRSDGKRPAGDATVPEPGEAAKRSGEGAATALKAMLQKRQQAERPDGPPPEAPPLPQP